MLKQRWDRDHLLKPTRRAKLKNIKLSITLCHLETGPASSPQLATECVKGKDTKRLQQKRPANELPTKSGRNLSMMARYVYMRSNPIKPLKLRKEYFAESSRSGKLKQYIQRLGEQMTDVLAIESNKQSAKASTFLRSELQVFTHRDAKEATLYYCHSLR